MSYDLTNPQTKIFGKTIAEINADFDRPLDEMVDDFLKQNVGFYLSEDNDFYHLHNVLYNSQLCVVSWTKKRLDINGEEHPQRYWIDNTQTTREKIAPAPLYDVCVEHLFQYKYIKDQKQKDLLEQVKEMFKDDFNGETKNRAVTSSRVFYKAKGNDLKVKDVVKHNVGYKNEESISVDFQGSDGHVNASCGFENELEAVLKARDCARVEQHYEWLTGKKAYLWRLNSVTQNDERAVVLGCNVGRFDVSCNNFINGGRPARGSVVVVGAPKNVP